MGVPRTGGTNGVGPCRGKEKSDRRWHRERMCGAGTVTCCLERGYSAICILLAGMCIRLDGIGRGRSVIRRMVFVRVIKIHGLLTCVNAHGMERPCAHSTWIERTE